MWLNARRLPTITFCQDGQDVLGRLRLAELTGHDVTVSGLVNRLEDIPVVQFAGTRFVPTGIIREVKVGSFESVSEFEEALDSHDW